MSKRQRTYQHIGVPGYGTEEHKRKLFELFSVEKNANINKKPMFNAALKAIRPLIERNLIQLTADHLPFGAAFRVPEHSYLGISMSKNSLHGQAINMDSVNDLFRIFPCDIKSRGNGNNISCFLTYLYPQWYASEKNASFLYISSELEKTHYKIIPLDSFTKSGLRFLKLTLPVYELKSVPGFLPGFQGTWDNLMTTPLEIVTQLTNVSSRDELSQLIQTVISQGISLDGKFFRTFAGKCDQLNITFDYYELFIQKMFQSQDIKMNQLMIESRFITTSWYKNVVTKLMTAGISVTNDPANKVYAFILAVALVDVITPLYMQHIVSDFVRRISNHKVVLSDENVKDLKDLCRQNLSSDQITDTVNRLSSSLSSLGGDTKQTLVKNLFNLSFSYNVISEVERNKMNFGIMNIELTNALIDFFETWYLKDILINSFSTTKTTMLGALLIGYEIKPTVDDLTVGAAYDMQIMYGNSFRHSEQDVDFVFALCLNILLFQLFPNKVAGYYLGQSIGLRPNQEGTSMIHTMNAELTMTQLYNQQGMEYIVRSVKRVNEFEFKTQSESDFGGGRRKRTRQKRQKKHIKSKSKPVSKRKKKVQYRTNRHN